MKYISTIANNKILYFICLLLISISINQHYGYIGVHPIDTFLFFDSGYRTLNGYFPFKDYWVITGPLIDIIQSIFFKIFGVSWFSYVLHASVFNFIIVFATFYTLVKFELNIHFSFFYALLVSIIAYPIAGTPFVDHHSTIFSLLALYSFILSIKTKLDFYWFFIPIFLGLAFLSKQTPAAYIGIIIMSASFVYFINNLNFKKILLLFTGTFFIIIIFSLFFIYNEISFLSFFEQYILFPLTIGEHRISSFFHTLEFNRLVIRFKLIHISQLVLLIIVIKNIIKNYKYLMSNEFLILISIIFTSYALIFHELLTLKQKFIFFIIPILLGFSHSYYEKNFSKKNYIVYLLIFLGIGSTLYYKIAYGDIRRFQALQNVNLNKSISSDIIDVKLKNLKWINSTYPNNPKLEIELLKNSIEILKKDKRKKALITHYQFIASLMPNYITSPNRTYTYAGISYPKKDNKYFEIYKKFFINQIVKNDIEIIYTIKPLEKNIFTSLINEDCINTKKINGILEGHLIHKCNDLKY